jgi:hypothetical protein
MLTSDKCWIRSSPRHHKQEVWKELICLLSLHYLTTLYEWQQKCIADGRFEYSSLHGRSQYSVIQSMNISIQSSCQSLINEKRVHHMKVKDGSRIGQVAADALSIIWRSISIQNSMVPHWLMQVLHPPQKFERPPFKNAWKYGIKMYGFRVTFSDMNSVLNFIEIYQLVQKLLRGTDRHSDW